MDRQRWALTVAILEGGICSSLEEQSYHRPRCFRRRKVQRSPIGVLDGIDVCPSREQGFDNSFVTAERSLVQRGVAGPICGIRARAIWPRCGRLRVRMNAFSAVNAVRPC